MEDPNRRKMLLRLRDLEGWAQFILEALHANPTGESSEREALEQTVEDQRLRRLRVLSWSLWDNLHRVNLELEHTRTVEDAMA